MNHPNQILIKQCPALGAAIILPLSMFLNGYWQGYTSPVLKEFQQLGYIDLTTIPIFSGCSFIGGILGIIFVGSLEMFLDESSLSHPARDRRSWLDDVSQWDDVVQLIFGIMGAAMCGSGMNLVYVIYISELAHKSRKKLFSRFIMCYLRLGILGAYILGIVLVVSMAGYCANVYNSFSRNLHFYFTRISCVAYIERKDTVCRESVHPTAWRFF